MTTLHVKKLWSLNPREYRYIPFQNAIKSWNEYIKNAVTRGHNVNELKDFDTWLKTEI